MFEEFINSPPSAHALDVLDEISATLCEVADLAEAVRCVHPDSVRVRCTGASGFFSRGSYTRIEWLQTYTLSANECFGVLQRCMDELNTDARLFAALSAVARLDTDTDTLSAEQRRFVTLNLAELASVGLGLPPDTRRRLLRLQQRLAEVGLGVFCLLLSQISGCH